MLVTREGYEHLSPVVLVHQTSTPNGTYRSALHRSRISRIRGCRAETGSQGTGWCDAGVMIYDIPHNRNVTIMTKLDSAPTLGAMTKFVHPRPKKPQ